MPTSTEKAAQLTFPAQSAARCVVPSARRMISVASPLRMRMKRCSPGWPGATPMSAAVAFQLLNDTTDSVSFTVG